MTPLRRLGRTLDDAARCRSGAAILEFALVLPILLALVAGTYEFGRALIVYRQAGEAARTAARDLARLPDPTCRPVCAPEVGRALAAAADRVARLAGLPAGQVTVGPIADLPDDVVGVRADVRVGAELLGLLGLAPLVTLRVARYEARLGP